MIYIISLGLILVMFLLVDKKDYFASKPLIILCLMLFCSLYFLVIIYTPKVYGNFQWYDFLFFLISFLLIFYKVFNVPLLNFRNLTRLNAASLLITSIIVTYFLLIRKIQIGNNFDLTSKQWLFTMLFTILSILAGIVAGYITGYIKFSPQEENPKNIYILIVFMVFFVALTEEIIFRGLILNYLIKMLNNSILAVIVGTLFYGFTHINKDMARTILSMVIGLAFSLLYMLTRNIFTVIIAHSITNVCWQLFFETKGINSNNRG